MEALYIVGGLMFGTALLGVARLFALPRWYRELQDFRQWRMAYYAGTLPELPTAPPFAQAPQPTTQAATLPTDATPLPGAAYALAKPPTSLQATLRWLQERDPNDRYTFPLGWYRNSKGEAALCYGSFVGDVNHTLVSGMSDAGKDNAVLGILFTLCLRLKPDKVQVCVIDGKGLDFAGWEGKSHTWGLALEPKQIAPMMARLSAERERRRGILAAAGASKWDAYQGDDLPLLIVYISELSLLEDATSSKDLTQWLNSELAAGRAFGLRYIVATQTASNFATRWRSQIGQYLAGYQPSESQDQPNTGLSTSELTAADTVPPSKLPSPPKGAGVFTAVAGRETITIRSTYLTDDQRRAWLSRLPDAPPVVELVKAFADGQHGDALQSRPTPDVPTPTTTPIAPALAWPTSATVGNAPANAVYPVADALNAATDTVAPPANTTPLVNGGDALTPATPRATIDVPDTERARISELATQGMSRRKICETVYGSISGRSYDRVKAVLDDLAPSAVPV